MTFSNDPLEKLWSALLSRNEKKIRESFEYCSHAEKREILAHLRKMTSEPGWHEEQVFSANFALKVLQKYTCSNDTGK